MGARHDSSYCSVISRRSILIALAILITTVTLPGIGSAQYSTTGRWTTLPNDVAGNSFDIVSGDLRGRGTHMALLRGANDSSWVVHWHVGEKARLWHAVPGRDTTTGLDVPLPVDSSQIFCAGHSLALMGNASRLVVVGGTLNVGQDDIGTTGTNKTVAFDPTSRQWTVLDTLTYDRWYPTSTTLGDGRVLATSGSSFYYQSVFGGRQSTSLRSDVRLMSGAKYPAWENDVTAGTPPSAREGHSMVMTEGFSFVWGGRTGSSDTSLASADYVYFLVSLDSDSGKVWDWSQVQTNPDPVHGRPAARAWHSAAMIDTDLVIYGGRSATGAQGDVWKLKGVPYGTRTWRKITVAEDPENGEPLPRFRHSAALDYQPPSSHFSPWARPRWLIQGGRYTDSTFVPSALWELRFLTRNGVPNDSAEWRLISPGGGAGPGMREGHVAVFDVDARVLRADTRRIFFHGGHRYQIANPKHELRSDVWILSRAATDTNWTAATWTQASFSGAVPGARRRHAATYNLHWHDFRMFGGDTTLDADTQGGESDAMWAFSLRPASNEAFTWRQIVAQNSGASARFGHSLVDEQSDGRHIFSHRSELFDPQGAKGDWSVMDSSSARRYLEWYPMMFLLRSGKLFFPGNAARAPGDTSSVLTLGSQTWSHRQFGKFAGGSAILLARGPGNDSDYVMKLGAMSNGGCKTCLAEGRVAIATIDSSTGYTTWRIANLSMPDLEKRKYQNVTLLPDSTALVSGGFDGTGEFPDGPSAAPPRKRPRIWKQSSMTWVLDELAEEPFQRGYHSTALLLPDGRVLSASGEEDGNPAFPNATIYWPPYLFNGNSLAVRPGIWAATDTIGYNKNFWICTNNPDSVQSVALIRPGSVTHGFNMDQRFVPLNFTKHQGLLRLEATSPVDSNLAPPGDYMLFIVNKRGVPSIAKWVRLRRGNSSANPDCGGGCPFLDTRTASGWEVENSILGRSASGSTVEDAYRLKSAPVVVNGRYQLRVRENEQEFTTLDELRLVAVDHSPEVRAWPFKDRAMLGTWSPPIRATTGDGVDVTHILDGNSESFFVGEPGETLLVDLTQNAPNATVGTTVETKKGEEAKPEVAPSPAVPSGGSRPEENDLDPFEIDDGGKGGGGGGGLMAGGLESIQRNVDAQVLASSGLLIQGRDAEGTWRTVRQRYPREHFDGFLVDTLDQGPVRIVFVGRHKLRRVGRVIPTETAIPTTLPLVVAQHSRLGAISGEVLDSGGETTVLTPGDTLALEFTATPVPEGQVRDFFLLTRGVYSSSNPGNESSLLGSVQPLRFALLQNQPNPFSTATSIHFELARAEKVRIEIFDPQGRLVRRLIDRRYEAGQWEIEWNRRYARGSIAAPGVYLYRMIAGSFRSQRKMVILP